MALDQCPVSLQVTSTREPANSASALVAGADARMRPFVVCCVCGDLLRNPQLLDCLHSCCADCCSAAVAASSAAEGGGDGCAVRCPICLDATPTQRLRRNDYAAAQVATHRLDALTAVCNACSTDHGGEGEQEKNRSKIEVVKWCSRCDMHLCADCSVWHDRFQKHHRAVVTRAEADGGSRPRLWQLLVPVACSEHGAARDAEFYCSDCRRFTCAECVRRCVGAGHSMEVAVAAPSGERARVGSQFRGRIAADVDKAGAALESIRPLLRRHASDLFVNLEASRAADRERLEERRREVLQSVASAFDRTAAELDAIYDGVRTEAADLRDRAVVLDAKAEHAAAYWAELREAAGATCLIGQQALVSARMRALADSAAALPPAFERDLWTLLGRQETRRADLDKVVAGWIGSPQRLKGSFIDVLVKGASEAPCSNVGQQDDNRETTTADRATPAAPTSLEEALSFESTAVVSFPVLGDCRDVACTADGRLLVAALREGLLQFDLPSGRQLKTWQPAPRWDGNQDSINVVAALDDGRVLIGDAGNDVVVLLRRDGDESWLECRRLFPGHGPWGVAVCGELAAVSSAHVEQVRRDETNSYSVVVGVQCSPGPRLTLLSLDTGRKQLELTLEYNVTSVALSSSTVVCASQYSLERAYQGDASFIDCYGHDGQRQWRHPFRELVASVLAVPSASVVYVSLPNSAMVVALSAGDGEVLCDVLTQARHGLAPPRALALCFLNGGGERTKRNVALAVLSFIEDKVALYRLATA